MGKLGWQFRDLNVEKLKIWEKNSRKCSYYNKLFNILTEYNKEDSWLILNIIILDTYK